MSLDQESSYLGLTKMPSGKSLPPWALHKTAGHQEATPRAAFLVFE
jgi:hypothetical protein